MRLPSLSFLLLLGAPPAQPLSLDGDWRFQLDRDNAGIGQRWFERTLSGSARLPGNLSAQGIGDDVTVSTKWTGGIVDRSYFNDARYERYRQPGNIKVPFWLQPDKYYAGAAWYQRDIEIPSTWAGTGVMLMLERPHWQTRVWLDGRELGWRDSLGTPHEYDLGAANPGRHVLTIRVDNSLVVDIGINSHSISDHTQGNWNGIVGRIELASVPLAARINNLQVYPSVGSRAVRVRAELHNATQVAARVRVGLTIEAGPPVSKEFTAAPGSTTVELEAKLGDGAQTWDEFSPVLYQLRLRVEGTGFAQERSATFGLREIAASGTQFTINGRRLFLRGTLECAIFPKTGNPPVDVESWRKLLLTARAYGLNHLRFHSWCPPEAAFVAADEMGFYYQVEASSWPNQSTSLGDGKPVDAWLEQETSRILDAYGNHPSFVLMSSTNEPGGRRANGYLAEWEKRHRAADPRRLYTSGSGWPQLPENGYHVLPEPRIQHWGEGLKSRINARPPETRTDYRDYIAQRTVPVVSHEIGQWCVYPNFDEIPKYTGYLKPRNFEIFRDRLMENHMAGQAHDFLMASGKLQALCYKEDIESALRTPGMGGFQLLALQDFPGQGTALVGALDPFWESKGYVSGAEFSRFSNSTVPLARLDKRVFTTDERLTADLEVSHFGAAPMRGVTPVWRLKGDDGAVVASGKLDRRDIPVDSAIALGGIKVDLAKVPAPARYKLVAGLEGAPFENDWDVWVYPVRADVNVPSGVTVARELDPAAQARLAAGGTVLLTIPKARVRGDVKLGFSSIFWNTAWTNGQAPHTLGILCDPKHAALARFPTESHSNWQWWYLVTAAGAMILDGLPPELKPVVQVIDDWFQARRLALVLEARVGAGKLLVSSIDLDADNPVSRQMKRSLVEYVGGPRFDPKVRLTVEQVRGMMTP